MGFLARLRSLADFGRAIYGYQLQSPQPLNPEWNEQKLIDSFFGWVYVCSSKNSCRVATVPLRLYTVSGNSRELGYRHRSLKGAELSRHQTFLRDEKAEVQELLSHPLVDLLNRVNSYQGRFELFELTELSLELTGNAYWWLVPGPLGLPGEILILPPQLVKINLDQRNLVGGFTFGLAPNEKKIPADQIVHFRFPNPNGSVYGYGPAQAAWGSILDYKAMQSYERALNANLGVPSLFISYEGTVEKAELSRIEADWNRKLRGIDKSGRAHVGDSKFKVTPIGLSPRDMSFREGRKWSRLEIADCFGVPVDLLDTENSNRATATQANYVYEQFTIKPRLTRIADKLNERLVPMYDSKLYVAYDENVPVDQAGQLAETVQLSNAGIITIDEARERYGLPPMPEDEKPEPVAPADEATPTGEPDEE